MKSSDYFIVQADALPEIFLKVAEAKRMLACGEARAVNEAAARTGISRSAFYKYRDAILPFQNMMAGRIVTFQLLLRDQQGVLASALGTFTARHANILTINSIIPTNEAAPVTITAETIDLTVEVAQLLDELKQLPGVLRADILAA